MARTRVSVVARGSNAGEVYDDLFTGKEIRLAAGAMRTLVLPEPAGGPVVPAQPVPGSPTPIGQDDDDDDWRPDPLPYAADVRVRFRVGAGLGLEALRSLRAGRDVALEVTGADKVALTDVRRAVENAAPTGGHLIIELAGDDD